MKTVVVFTVSHFVVLCYDNNLLATLRQKNFERYCTFDIQVLFNDSTVVLQLLLSGHMYLRTQKTCMQLQKALKQLLSSEHFLNNNCVTRIMTHTQYTAQCVVTYTHTLTHATNTVEHGSVVYNDYE